MAGSVAAREDGIGSGRKSLLSVVLKRAARSGEILGHACSDAEHRREPRKPPFKFLVPLVYAPVLPLIRIGLRKQPVLRDRVFTVVLAAALLHGGYLVSDLYDAESK